MLTWASPLVSSSATHSVKLAIHCYLFPAMLELHTPVAAETADFSKAHGQYLRDPGKRRRTLRGYFERMSASRGLVNCRIVSSRRNCSAGPCAQGYQPAVAPASGGPCTRRPRRQSRPGRRGLPADIQIWTTVGHMLSKGSAGLKPSGRDPLGPRTVLLRACPERLATAFFNRQPATALSEREKLRDIRSAR